MRGGFSQDVEDSHYSNPPLTVEEHKQELRRSIERHQRVIQLIVRANPEDLHINDIEAIIKGLEENLKELKKRPPEEHLFLDNSQPR